MRVVLLSSIAATLLVAPLVRRTRMAGLVAASAIPAALFAFFIRAGLTLPDDRLHESAPWIPSARIALAFSLDGFSLLFALIITGVGTLVTIYAGAYFADAPGPLRARFITLILLFMTSMLGAVLADDLVLLFVFWEATSVLSFLLIGFHAERQEARKAALQALLVTAGGGLALLAGILLLGIAAGTFSLRAIVLDPAPVLGSPLAMPAMALVMLGAFTKSAQVPFHFWLPAAMEAPTPASAYLHSATMVKLGVYVLARFDSVFSAVPAFGVTLLAVGSITTIVSGVRAVAADGYKAVLAHSTVASLGVLVMLIGLEGEQAAAATVGFILAHALYKAALFFCAGTVIHATHEGRLTRLSGLGGELPLTAAAAMLAAAAMAGLPPTLGFVAKEALLTAYLGGAGALALAVTVAVNALFVAIAGIAGVAPFLRSNGKLCRVDEHETPGLAAAPLLLGAAGFLFGIIPGPTVGGLLDVATGALTGVRPAPSWSAWHGLTPALGFSAAGIVLGVMLLRGWRWMHGRLSNAPTVERTLGDAAYDAMYGGLLGLATRTTRVLQNGDQHRYSFLALTFVVVAASVALGRAGVPLALNTGSGTFDPASAVVLALMAAGALAATRTPSLLRSVIAIGIVGFGSALIYVLNGAPDLALTQFSVEVLVVVILAALLLRIPTGARTRTVAERRLDALVSVAVGGIIFVALAAMLASTPPRDVADFYASRSLVEAHGRNVVNVIIVDFRGMDTLGEISVVAIAATAVWSLLKRRRRAA